MITIEVWLNDQFLTSYWADGLIMATPTGSTGYSLSCGGPAISPGAKSFVLTPIAPHANLNARPLVIEDDTVIKLKVSGRESQHLITVDSKITTMANEEEIVVKKTPYKLKMLNFKGEHFLHSLRQNAMGRRQKKLITVFSCFLFSWVINAQRIEFGYLTGFSSGFGDVGREKVFCYGNTTQGLQLKVHRNSRLSYRLNTNLIKFTFDDELSNDQYRLNRKFKSNINAIEITAGVEFNWYSFNPLMKGAN